MNLTNNDHRVWKRNCVRYAINIIGSYFKLCVYREVDTRGKFGEHSSCSQLRHEHLFTLSAYIHTLRSLKEEPKCKIHTLLLHQTKNVFPTWGTINHLFKNSSKCGLFENGHPLEETSKARNSGKFWRANKNGLKYEWSAVKYIQFLI